MKRLQLSAVGAVMMSTIAMAVQASMSEQSPVLVRRPSIKAVERAVESARKAVQLNVWARRTYLSALGAAGLCGVYKLYSGLLGTAASGTSVALPPQTLAQRLGSIEHGQEQTNRYLEYLSRQLPPAVSGKSVVAEDPSFFKTVASGLWGFGKSVLQSSVSMSVMWTILSHTNSPVSRLFSAVNTGLSRFGMTLFNRRNVAWFVDNHTHLDRLMDECEQYAQRLIGTVRVSQSTPSILEAHNRVEDDREQHDTVVVRLTEQEKAYYIQALIHSWNLLVADLEKVCGFLRVRADLLTQTHATVAARIDLMQNYLFERATTVAQQFDHILSASSIDGKHIAALVQVFKQDLLRERTSCVLQEADVEQDER